MLKFERFSNFIYLILPITIILGNAALNINILFIIFIFFIKFIKNDIKINRSFLNIVITLFFFIITNYYFSHNKALTLQGSSGLIKNILLFLSLCLFFSEEKKKKKFLKISFVITLFVCFDTFVQYIFKYDLFLNHFDESHGKRLSGPFGSEYVVGAFISKMMFFVLAYIVYYKKNDSLLYLSVSLFLITIFLSQERSAFYVSLISSLIFIIFSEGKIKFKIISILIFIFLSLFFISTDKTLGKKYIGQTTQQLGISKQYEYLTDKKSEQVGDFVIESFWDSRYGAHFLTAYAIFKDNKFFGSGIKTFRTECSKSNYASIKSKYVELRCNTHPHNIFYEIISDGGIFLFAYFLISISFLIFLNLTYFLKSFHNKYLLNLMMLFVLFFPIQTTGSFFSTFNGIFYWLLLSLIVQSSGLKIFNTSFKKQ